MNKNRRFKWVFIFAMLAFMVVSQLIAAHAIQSPPQTRRLLGICAMALLMLPTGFIYGRNSGRKDDLGKIARFWLAIVTLALCAGVVAGPGWAMLHGICVGFLAGYALGWIVWKRAREKYGDSLEADQVMNITRSEHTPPEEHPIQAYLKSQDAATRRCIWKLRITELLLMFASFGGALWLAFADRFDGLARAMLTHPGDGTLYFITTDPIVIAIPLMMLSVCACGLLSEWLLPTIAGPRRDVWLEFKRLRNTKRGSRTRPKLAGALTTYAAIASVVVLVSSVLLFMDSYVRVTRDGIELNRYWGLGARFCRWTDVRAVDVHQEQYTCRKCGQIHQRLCARVIFADGTEWKPDTSFARRERQIEQAVRYAAERENSPLEPWKSRPWQTPRP